MSPPTHFSLAWSKSPNIIVPYHRLVILLLMPFYLTYFSVNKVPVNEKHALH